MTTTAEERVSNSGLAAGALGADLNEKAELVLNMLVSRGALAAIDQSTNPPSLRVWKLPSGNQIIFEVESQSTIFGPSFASLLDLLPKFGDQLFEAVQT